MLLCDVKQQEAQRSSRFIWILLLDRTPLDSRLSSRSIGKAHIDEAVEGHRSTRRKSHHSESSNRNAEMQHVISNDVTLDSEALRLVSKEMKHLTVKHCIGA